MVFVFSIAHLVLAVVNPVKSASFKTHFSCRFASLLEISETFTRHRDLSICPRSSANGSSSVTSPQKPTNDDPLPLPNLRGFNRLVEPKAGVEYEPSNLLRFIEKTSSLSTP